MSQSNRRTNELPINRKIIFVLQDNVDFVFRQIKFEEKEGESDVRKISRPARASLNCT